MYTYKISNFQDYDDNEVVLIHEQYFSQIEFIDHIKNAIESLKADYLKEYDCEMDRIPKYYELESKMCWLFGYEELDCKYNLDFRKLIKELN